MLSLAEEQALHRAHVRAREGLRDEALGDALELALAEQEQAAFEAARQDELETTRAVRRLPREQSTRNRQAPFVVERVCRFTQPHIGVVPAFVARAAHRRP